MKWLLAVIVVFGLGSVLAAENSAPAFTIANFDDPADLKKFEHDSSLVDLTVGPRTPTEMNNVMKYVVKGGEYPGFTLNVPQIPKDWSKFETLSFVVWSPNDAGLGVRIDDEKSFNFNSRFNGDAKASKGRTLIQIPLKNIAKSVDPTRIKALIIFMVSPPKDLTLYFDDFKLGPTLSEKVEFIPYKDRFDLTPSLEFVTPHLEMGRNLAGGPVSTFMLTSVRYGREVVELMQRMDLTVSQLTWDREWGANTWGFGDFYGNRGHSIDYVLMQKYLDSSMQGPEKFGAMVMYTPLGWNRFTKSAREAIVRRVKEDGEGLVFVMPFPGDQGQPWPDDLKEICALVNSQTDWIRDGCDIRYANDGRIIGKKWTKTKDHPITAGVPLEALPFAGMEVQKYEPAPGAEVLLALESGEPILAVRQVGKGRVVTFATRALSLTPVISTPEDRANKIPYRFWESWYNLENRAIAWAAGRDFKRDGTPVDLKAEGAHADPYFALKQWKDAAGKVTDWELAFTPPKTEPKKVALTLPDAVAPGAPVKVTFTPPAGVEGAEWSVVLGEVADNSWRTLEKMSAAVKDAAPVTVELPTTRVRQYIADVNVEARKDGQLIASGTGEVIVTPEPKWDDYEIHTWLESGLPFLQDYEQQRMRDFGLTCNTVGPTDFPTCMRLFRGDMRVHGCGLTNGLHAHDIDGAAKAYNANKDKKFLVRNPSYADDAFVAKERDQVKTYADGLKKFAPLSMIMSDETALTSYTMEFDYDFHPDNIAKFREKLKARFETPDAMNAALGTSVKSFDEVQPPTSDEAKAAKNFGLWNLWRSHNDDMWTGAFKMYGEAMKEKFPATRISVSGTQESAIFNGIDWAKLTPTFGAVCGYGGRFQELQRLSFHPGGLRVTPWGGYGRSGRSVDQQVWSSLTTGGSGMGLFWWYSIRNADLTFCKSGKDYQRVFSEVKAGIGKQYMESTRRFSPVAVLWSANSQRASWSLGKFEDFKKVEADVVNGLTNAEFDPFFVSEESLAAGKLTQSGAKAVFLPMSISLGLGAKKGGVGVIPALEKFIAGGGMVVITDDVAFDEFLQPAALPDALKGKVTKFVDVQADLIAALAKSGVKPWVRCADEKGARIKGVSSTVHKLPGGADAWLITLVRSPIGFKDIVGADGVIHSVPDAEGGKEVETISLDVSNLGAMNFYDVRNKTPLTAAGGKITLKMQAGDGYPIAALPYTVDAVTAAAASADRMMKITWQLKGSAAAFATHVARVEVIDLATGQADRNLSANVDTGADGKGTITFPLAFEDANRKLGVRVRDVLSGKSVDVK